ncbi:single-stranded DNA-binding protein [Janibacter sp. GS2]|uniref:single-stranded DNA-binding protein n=1 Tax=Janibacter sp. GS2 TaxID=3442646 RepID=UPI003EBB2F71
MNEAELTIAGRVVADPEHRTTRSGMQFTTFRMASTVRRRTKEGVYVDAATSFYNVAAFRALGMNAHASLHKGDPVLVHGRLTINTWQRADESWGSSAELEAISLGHDLTFGTTAYTKAGRSGVDEGADEAAQRSLTAMTERIAGGDGPGWGAPPPVSPGGEPSGTAGEDAGEREDEDVRLPA